MKKTLDIRIKYDEVDGTPENIEVFIVQAGGMLKPVDKLDSSVMFDSSENWDILSTDRWGFSLTFGAF